MVSKKTNRQNYKANKIGSRAGKRTTIIFIVEQKQNLNSLYITQRQIIEAIICMDGTDRVKCMQLVLEQRLRSEHWLLDRVRL